MPAPAFGLLRQHQMENTALTSARGLGSRGISFNAHVNKSHDLEQIQSCFVPPGVQNIPEVKKLRC